MENNNINRIENKNLLNNILKIIKRNKLVTLLFFCLIVLSLFTVIRISYLKKENRIEIKELTQTCYLQVTKAISISVNNAIENNEKGKLEQLMVKLTQQEKNIKKIIIVNNVGIIIKATDKKFENQEFKMSEKELRQDSSIIELNDCIRIIYPINSYFLIIDFNK